MHSADKTGKMGSKGNTRDAIWLKQTCVVGGETQKNGVGCADDVDVGTRMIKNTAWMRT